MRPLFERRGFLSSRRAKAVFAVWAVLAVAIYLSTGNGFFFERISGIGEDAVGGRGFTDYLRQLRFASLHLVMLAVILSIPFLTPALRLLVALPLLFSYLVEESFMSIKGRALLLPDIAVLNDALDNVSDAASEFDGELAVAVLKALALFGLPIVLGFFLVSRPRRAGAVVLGGVLTCAAAYGYLLLTKRSSALDGFPYSLAYPLGSAAIVADAALRDDSQRISLDQLVRTPPPVHARHIVLVIDESVEGDAFSHLRRHRPPLPGAVDFGLAFSAANCSSAANYALRRGAPGEMVPIVDAPSLFALARQAGMATIYFDNQRNTLRSLFQREEFGAIDEVVLPDDATPKWARDMRSLELILDRLQPHESVFLVVNKIGTHFPYDASLPPGQGTGKRLTDYLRSLQLHSLDFLRGLAVHLPPETVVFYTSDHGQNFSSKTTHCNIEHETVVSEWRVPFIALASGAALEALQQAAPSAMGLVSHFEISETIRHLLGYRSGRAASLFDRASLAALPTEFCGVYGAAVGLFGQSAECRRFSKAQARAELPWPGGATLAADAD
jgi:hypothetical protein